MQLMKEMINMTTRINWSDFDKDCKYHRSAINKDIISGVRKNIDPNFMKTTADKKEFKHRYKVLINYLKQQKNQRDSIRKQVQANEQSHKEK